MSRDALEDMLALNGSVGDAEISSDGRLLIVEDEAGGLQVGDPWTGDGNPGGESGSGGMYAGPAADGAFQTDFERTMEQVDESQVGNDGKPLSEFDAKFKYRVLQEQERDDISPLVNIIPLSIRRAQRGGNATVTSGAPAVQVIAWQGEEGEIVSMVISFSAPATIPQGDGKSYRPYATIAWGSDSTAQSMTVDICRGQQIIVSGGSLYVSVGMDAAPSGESNGTMLLGATFGGLFGAKGTAPAQRTVYVDALPNNGVAQNFLIPLCATSMLPPGVVDQSPNVQFNFKDSNNVVRATYKLQTPGQFVAPVPIGNTYYSFDLINTGGAGTTNMDIVFQLSC